MLNQHAKPDKQILIILGSKKYLPSKIMFKHKKLMPMVRIDKKSDQMIKTNPKNFNETQMIKKNNRKLDIY